MATCYRHPSRETGVSCSNCGRPICPDCMTPTAVGMRCPECSKQRTKVTRMRSSTAAIPRVTYALIVANVAAFLAEGGQFSLAGSSVHGSVVEEGDLYRDRSRKPASSIEETDALTALHTTEQLVEGRDQLSRVLDGVRRLPDDRREALIMRFALGMDNREIARALGRTDGATKVLIHRAIKQLEGVIALPEDSEQMQESR